MARDAKLTFNWTYDNAASQATGGLRIGNFAASGTATNAYVWNPAGGSNYNFQRAVSSALNKSGFRDQQADQSQLTTTNSVVSAISNDPSVFGNTEMYEAYVRVTYGGLGPAPITGTQMWIVVEGASDSGTGTAGTDWSPISGSINLATPTSAVARLIMNTTTVPGTATGGLFTLSSHGLQVGDIVVFTALSGGTQPTANQPYFVSSVPSPNTFYLASTLNGANLTTFAVTSTSTVAYATPAARRVISIPVSPTVKPWLRVAVYGVSTAAAALPASAAIWIQDAFITIGRDSAALA